MEEYVIHYEKQYPFEPESLCVLLGYPTEETPDDLPDILPEEVPAEAQYFAKLAVWISKQWHIDISVAQYVDCISVVYTFPEHCTFFTPYLSEMKELFQLTDTAHIVPDYEKQILAMVLVFGFPENKA